MATIPPQNQQISREINLNFQELNNKIFECFTQYNQYVNNIKDEKYNEDPRETWEVSIKRAEGVLERLEQSIKRIESSSKKADEAIGVLNKVVDLLNKFSKNMEDERNGLVNKRKDLNNKIAKLKGKNQIKPLLPFTVQPNTKSITNFIENNKIEEWTGMKVGEVLFDTNINGWSIPSLLFRQKIMNKGNLIFLIEDDDANLFGSYLNAKIDKIGDWINDPKSFVFSLKSNGRLNGMFKFNIAEPMRSFILAKEEEILLGIGSGYDICVCKGQHVALSYCRQLAFNYNGIQNALCGKTHPTLFNPKRVSVIQLGYQQTIVQLAPIPIPITTPSQQNQLFVKNLPYSLTDGEFLNLFSRYGATDAKIIRRPSKKTNSYVSKGYGFVTVPNELALRKAINEMNGADVDGRTIVVAVAEKKDDENKK